MLIHGFAALFFAFTVFAILRGIYRGKHYSGDSICGAFCGYILIGLAFGHLFTLTESLVPGSFQGNPEFGADLHDLERVHFLLSYFSFITLTTVGYGVIHPVRTAARTFAVAEAILGQFYLAVLIADLVGKKIAHALSHPEMAREEEAATLDGRSATPTTGREQRM